MNLFKDSSKFHYHSFRISEFEIFTNGIIQNWRQFWNKLAICSDREDREIFTLIVIVYNLYNINDT